MFLTVQRQLSAHFKKCVSRHANLSTTMKCLPEPSEPSPQPNTTPSYIEPPTKPDTTQPIPITQSDAIHIASAHLRNHQVIALPTDTIYGFACCANSETAIRRLYDIKGREQTKAVAICVARIEDVRHWAHADHLPSDLLRKLLPGPVTLVLDKRDEHLRNPFLNPGFRRIAIRIPDAEFIRRLCEDYGGPIALTSANRSAAQSTLRVREFEALWPSLAAVFDGGALGLTEEQRAGSTIVDLSSVEGVGTVVRRGVAVEETLRVVRSYGIRIDEKGDNDV